MTLTTSVAALNILLGVVYMQVGAMIVIDLKRGWRQLGFSHFGVAFAALTFTCGPHHFVHGLHMALGSRQAGVFDLITVLVGLPAGLIWFGLRIEAFAGGRGDRQIAGTPFWVFLLPTLAGGYVTALAVAAVANAGAVDSFQWTIVPNVLLIGVYSTIAYYLLRTQIQNHVESGGWSLSGLTLALIFGTCPLMHAAYVYYSLSGAYRFDAHGFAIDWLSVPAGIYFLWAVIGLYRARLSDWNREPNEMTVPAAAAAASPSGALVPAR
jgi:hypothetical protein